MKKDTAAFATELMPSVWLCGQLPAAVAKGGLARPPFAQLGSPPPSKTSNKGRAMREHKREAEDL
jgi:hypothetical protein